MALLKREGNQLVLDIHADYLKYFNTTGALSALVVPGPLPIGRSFRVRFNTQHARSAAREAVEVQATVCHVRKPISGLTREDLLQCAPNARRPQVVSAHLAKAYGFKNLPRDAMVFVYLIKRIPAHHKVYT